MTKKTTLIFTLVFTLFMAVATAQTRTGQLRGRVTDAANGEPIIGATVIVEGTTLGASTDLNGEFHLTNIPAATHRVTVNFLSYKPFLSDSLIIQAQQAQTLDVALAEEVGQLEQVVVVGTRKVNTDVGLLSQIRNSTSVVSGISSQTISRTLDKDAAEVVKRVPGITIMDERFVVIRGLNQRYNNVWLNNVATPSSETDVKAFSFDAIPSSMIDNVMIYKTAAPELPGEATGGFIKITTKNMPDRNFLHVDYSAAVEESVTFKDVYLDRRAPGERWGFNTGYRNIPSGVPAYLEDVPYAARDKAALRFNNNWVYHKEKALPNQKIGLNMGRRWELKNNMTLGNVTSVFYSNSYDSKIGINHTYKEYTQHGGVGKEYDMAQYDNTIKVGALFNWVLNYGVGQRIEFKNMLDQSVKNSTNTFEGRNDYRSGYYRYNTLAYTSRTTYSGQFSGNHPLGGSTESVIDWNAGFSYANKREPDRRVWSQYKTDADAEYRYVIPGTASVNELGRLWLENDEYVTMGSFNYRRVFGGDDLKVTLRTGLYGEYKTRSYGERSFGYRSTNTGLNDAALSQLPFEDLFTSEYLGRDKSLYMEEQTSLANYYDAQNRHLAAYVGGHLEWGAFSAYVGLRAEYNNMLIDGYYDARTPVTIRNERMNLFPSVNLTYNVTSKSLFRLAYGRTINRPEFREVSPLMYYDFSELATYLGNPDLKDALIDNFDFRFETYGNGGDMITAALFYKKFQNPIEVTSFGGSGSNYTFSNAPSASAYGVELDLRKSLDFIGVPALSVVANGALIQSNVFFTDEQKGSERDRGLQGQSPYIVNVGLFCQLERLGISSSLMYNVMGKRILIAAEMNGPVEIIPSIYEDPRNLLNFSLSKKWGKKTEIKFGIKDILAEDYSTSQTFKYVDAQGAAVSKKVPVKRYANGRTYSLGVALKF